MVAQAPDSEFQTSEDGLDRFWQKHGKDIVESLKELGRYILAAFVPMALNYVSGLNLSPFEMLMMASILRGLDKFIHRVGKESNNAFLEKGLTRF